MKTGLHALLGVLTLLSLLASPSHSNAADPPTVPFTLDRDKIIIPTSVNGSDPLGLILDTGMRFDGVYLFHTDALRLIDTTGAIEVKVPGAGGGEASSATMIETGRIGFGEMSISDQRVIVSHSVHTQTFPTDGVIGWNLFGHYIVEIDYDNRRIHLHDTSYVVPDTGWQHLPVEMKKDMPYVRIEVEVVSGETVPMTVYIDLASGEGLELLVHPDQPFTMPESLVAGNLGTGLSGDINGHYGRSRRLRLGGYELTDIPTAFAPLAVRSKLGGADGILGNASIRRFNVVFDYPHSLLHIKPNAGFDEPFD